MRFPCVHAVATTPAQRLGILFARFLSRINLLRNGCRIGLCDVLFEACSAFTHVTACTLAGSPKATPYIGGFSYFVTSITAPIASGRSDLAGWDFHPLEKRRLITAHARKRHSPVSSERQVNLESCHLETSSDQHSRTLSGYSQYHMILKRSLKILETERQRSEDF